MGLIKDTSFDIPGFGEVPITGVYWMIDNAKPSKLASALAYDIVAWKDQKTREAYRSAQTDYVSKLIALRTAEGALAAQLPGQGDTPGSDSLKAKEAASGALRIALAQAQLDHEQAAQAVSAFAPLRTLSRVIPMEEVSLYVTEGHAEIAKLYAREKATPDFADAKDA